MDVEHVLGEAYKILKHNPILFVPFLIKILVLGVIFGAVAYPVLTKVSDPLTLFENLHLVGSLVILGGGLAVFTIAFFDAMVLGMIKNAWYKGDATLEDGLHAIKKYINPILLVMLITSFFMIAPFFFVIFHPFLLFFAFLFAIICSILFYWASIIVVIKNKHALDAILTSLKFTSQHPFYTILFILIFFTIRLGFQFFIGLFSTLFTSVLGTYVFMPFIILVDTYILVAKMGAYLEVSHIGHRVSYKVAK